MRFLAAVFATAILASVSTAAFSQATDCAASARTADQTACYSAKVGRQKAVYEGLLMQLRRANPGSLDMILAVNRQKMQELNAQCQNPACVDAWYTAQIDAIRQGSWADAPQPHNNQNHAVAEADTPPAAIDQLSNRSLSANVGDMAEKAEAAPFVLEERPDEARAVTSEVQKSAGSSSEETEFKAWQAAQAQEPEVAAAVEAPPNKVREAEPLSRSKSQSVKSEAFNDIGFFTLLFSAIIGLPLAYPVWKIIVWMDRYMISRAERYHRSAAAILLTQFFGSIAVGLFLGFLAIMSIRHGLGIWFD